MSDKSMVTGQLYRVGVTCISPNERCTMELLLVAASNEDAKARLPWLYDFVGWTSYRVDWTVKEPGRCVALKTKFERTPENEPDASIARPEGTQAMFQKVAVAAGKKYEVKAQTVLYAKSPDHARRKLAERVDGGSEFVRYSIEELAEASAYAVARDVSVFPRATFVRG
jgi:hypothetical protein